MDVDSKISQEFRVAHLAYRDYIIKIFGNIGCEIILEGYVLYINQMAMTKQNLDSLFIIIETILVDRINVANYRMFIDILEKTDVFCRQIIFLYKNKQSF